MDTVEAEERGYPLESCSEVEMLFGQGDVRVSSLKTHIGEIEATVLDNVPTLISPVPIIEAGGSLHLEGSGGHIANANHSSVCELTRTNGQWTCDLDCIERFVIRPPPEPDPILLTNFQDPFCSVTSSTLGLLDKRTLRCGRREYSTGYWLIEVTA
jgi:hypothetical protein